MTVIVIPPKEPGLVDVYTCKKADIQMGKEQNSAFMTGNRKA